MNKSRVASNQNIQVYVRVRPLNERERCIRSSEVVTVVSPREIETRHTLDAKLTKKFTFDRTFAPESRQVDVYNAVVAPLIEEVLAGYNCTVFAYGQTGTGKTHTMVGNELVTLSSAWDDNSDIGIIPRALCHLFDELRMTQVQFSMRVSYLELYNEELCDLLSVADDTTAKIRIFDDAAKKGSVILNGLEEVTVHNKDDVYKLLEKGQERRKTAKTLMNAQSSRSHTVFSIVVHMRETDIATNEEMVKIGKLNLVDLAGSENVSKAGNEKPIRVRETVNINQSLLTLGRVITALVERTPHIPYRESKLTRLLQESLGGRTKTAIIATISPGHKDIEETLSTLEYAHRAKNIQNRPELNQRLSQRAVLNQYTEEIDKLKRDLIAVREKNGVYLADETYNEMTTKMDSQRRELNEKILLLKAIKDEIASKEKIFNEVTLKLIDETTAHLDTQKNLTRIQENLKEIEETLHKTQKRYQEKKMLLDEHVKTEEELTTQATQILQVADVATEETQKLHHTIELRKHIDEKIESASDRLLSHVNDNFHQMDAHISSSRKQNDKFVEMSLEEIKEATACQEKLHEQTDVLILNMKQKFQHKIEQILQMQQKNLEKCCHANNEATSSQQAEIKQILEKTQTFVQDLKEDFNVLHKHSQEEKLSLKDLRAKTEEMHMSGSSANAEYVTQLQQNLMQAQQQLAENMQTINTLKEQLKHEMQLQQQSQSTICELQQQMQNFANKMQGIMGESQLHTMEQQVHEFEQRHKSSEQLLKNIEGQGLAYNEEQQKREKAALHNVLNFADSRVERVQQMDVVMAKSTKHVEMYVEVAGQDLHNLNKDLQKAEEQFNKESKQTLCDLQDNLNSAVGDLSAAQSELQTYVQQQCQSINERHALTGSLLCSLQTDVWQNLEEKYAHIRNNCLKDVTDIKQSELKTYQSTGMTPSKRDYCYPRTLKCTAPHEKLIKRFRMQNNENELDLSQTIMEDDDGENLHNTETTIMQELPLNLLNSTPISNMDTMKTSMNENVQNSFEQLDARNLSRKRNNSTSHMDYSVTI